MAYSETERADAVSKVIKGLSKGIPLTVICSEDDMPCDDTVRSWAEGDEQLSRAIARARDAGWDVIAHRIRATARGKGPEEGGDSTGDVQRDKLIAEYDLKLLAKWDPKRYGDLVKLGGDDRTPLTVTLAPLDDRL